jgi:hypothetical protein
VAAPRDVEKKFTNFGFDGWQFRQLREILDVGKCGSFVHRAKHGTFFPQTAI